MVMPPGLVELLRGAFAHPAALVAPGLALAVLVRLALGDRRAGRWWTLGLAGAGLVVFAARTLMTVIAPGDSGWDLEIFYRTGQEVAAGLDPYRHPGRDVALNPPPAHALFRTFALLPYPAVRAGWS